ncbi:hypothetical protein [Specibacter sp. NPDC078709]|uniref:hypothetical protein n=1 Tax=Specibacter sp. NPDC078709 TaxID=3154364 RepID=UPI00342295F5
MHHVSTPFKSGVVVRRSAFNYRYDTVTERGLRNELWPLVNLRKNLFLPTKKVTGIILIPQRHQLAELYASLDLAGPTNRINEIQPRLIRLAAAKTCSQSPHAA